MITPIRFRQVVSLAEHRSFRRATPTPPISQPSLTKSIQVLDATLGVKLFDRQHGGVVLTDFGEQECKRRYTIKKPARTCDLNAGVEDSGAWWQNERRERTE